MLRTFKFLEINVFKFLKPSRHMVRFSNSPEFQFHNFSWFRTFTFPEITLLKISKQLSQNVKCFFSIISMFKMFKVVTYFLGKKSPKAGVILAQP